MSNLLQNIFGFTGVNKLSWYFLRLCMVVLLRPSVELLFTPHKFTH